MRTYLYEPGQGLARDLSLKELIGYLGKKGAYFWIDLQDAAAEEIKRLGVLFNFHPLAIEDCIQVQQRPKVDVYDNCLFIVLRDPDWDLLEKGMRALELDIFLGENFLITVHQQRMECIELATSKLDGSAERLLGRGPDFLAHTITDLLVEDHMNILNSLDEEISTLEEQIFENPDQEALKAVANMRKNILYLQRILGPQLELIRRFSWEELPFIDKSLRIYFRDIYDSLARINDIVYNYREIVTTDMAIHQAIISNKLNEIMKTLAIIATIILPPTLVASIYGMNFQFMPELDWKYGYLWALGLMLFIGGGIYYYFRRKGWFGK